MAIADLNLVVQVLAAAKRLPMAVSFRMKSISRPKLQVLDLERCQENGGYIGEETDETGTIIMAESCMVLFDRNSRR